ncbi:NAD(P)-binding protein, partial [Kibdelosporangium lantanae]
MTDVDLLIVGAGPTGLFAAYYAGFRDLSTAIVDSLPEPGGQVTAMYPEKMIFDVAGFPAVRGRDLVANLVEQAAQWKPTYLLGRKADTLTANGSGFNVGLGDGSVVHAGAVLITAGIGEFTPRPLPAGDGWLGRGMVHFVPVPQPLVQRLHQARDHPRLSTLVRAELESRGEKFTTNSDTEVVLRAYLVWGEAFVDRLNGMYAFAIWDSRSHKLVMVRDRMGIKPFYFYPTADGVLFGSEPKAILANPLARPVVDAQGFRELVGFIKTPGDAFWKGMKEVVPGTVVTVTADGIKERTYWKLESREHTDDVETTVGHVRELLDDIVRRQLVSDVPECVLL